MSTDVQDPIRGSLDDVERAREAQQRAVDALALRIVVERKGGASVRSLAARYEVPPSAVHSWTQRGRELQATGIDLQLVDELHTRTLSENSPVVVLPVWTQWALVVAVLASVASLIIDLVSAIFAH
jgi:hypothetical protein